MAQLTIKKHIDGTLRPIMSIVICLIFILVSCQKENLTNSNKVILQPIIESQIDTVVVNTRALTGYSNYTDNRQRITAYAIAYTTSNVREPEEDVTGAFYPSSTAWQSSVNATEGFKYYLYGHTAIPGASTPVLNFTSESNVTLSFSGLNVISENDPMVCTAAAGKILPDNPSVAEYPELNKWSFDIGKVENIIAGGDSPATSTKVFLALDHLYAKATVSFMVNTQYDELRTIKLTQAEITVAQGNIAGNHTYNFMNGTLTLASTTPTGSAVAIDIMDGENAIVSKDVDSESEVTLTTTWQDFGWFCFLPQRASLEQVALKVTYNVYDKKGNLLREDQTATNTGMIYKIGSPAAGHDYKLKVTVSPTYLYQLSDDDVELNLEFE